MARINIGGLPWEASEDDVKQLLREHSVDEVQEVVKQYDHEGRYTGCMLATLYSADVAQNAIDRLNNIAFMNQNIWAKWFGAGWPSMRGPRKNGQSRKSRGRIASKSAPCVKSDARENVSHSGSWCYACNRRRNMAGECGCQSLSVGLSQEELYRQQWMNFYQSSYLAQGYNNNQVPTFQSLPPVLKPIFIPPGPATNQQTADDLHTGRATILSEAGFIEEPCFAQGLPSSRTPPPPPGTSPTSGPVQRQLAQPSDSTFASSVPTPALSKTKSESVMAHSGKINLDVQILGEQVEVKAPKKDMARRKNHEVEGKKRSEEKYDIDDVNAVDSDLATALAGLLKEERRERKIVARQWRCLLTDQPPSDSDSSSCTPILPDLATVYARLQREEKKGKMGLEEKKRKRRQSESAGDSAGQLSGHIASSLAVDPSLVRCDYCPLPGLVQREEVNQHLKEIHSQVLFSCSFCSSSFPYYFEAQHHVKTKHDGQGLVVRPEDNLLVTHKCLRCGARFTSREEVDVRDHVRKEHTGWATVRWECRLCAESFPGKQEFEEHLSGRHAATLAKTTTEQVQKVPFTQYWKEEVEKKQKKLMTEELRRRKTLKFKMTSSDSSSSSSEEEDQAGVDNQLQRFFQKKTRKYFESKECPGNETIKESDVRLKNYNTLYWACAFVASSEKEESRELSIRKKVAPIDEICPKDFFRQKKKRKEKVIEKEDKSSGECSTSENEGSSHDSDDTNLKDQFDEEKLLSLQTRLEKALEQRKVLTKRDERRLKKVEEYDAFFTDGFLLEDEEAATEVSSEVEDCLRKSREDIEMHESNIEESAVESNNNLVEDKLIGLDSKALEQMSLSEEGKGRGEMDGNGGSRARGKHGRKRKLEKISPLRVLFPRRFKMGWKRVEKDKGTVQLQT